MKIRYTIDTLRAGQPRAYADSEFECLIKVEFAAFDQEYKPWCQYGNRMDIPDLVARRDAWAKSIVKLLFRSFREAGDQDGKEGTPGAYFAATLKWLKLDAAKGEIWALIVEPFTD